MDCAEEREGRHSMEAGHTSKCLQGVLSAVKGKDSSTASSSAW